MKDELALGTRLGGRYEILREAGRGECSIVYEARDLSSGTIVGLKVVTPPPATAHLLRARLLRDAEQVRELEHPSIARVLEVFDIGDRMAIVMQWISGGDLERRVADRGPLAPGEVIEAARSLARALSAAHVHGLLHRDVKPQNVLFAADGRAVLSDFGCARLEGQGLLVETENLVQTRAFLPPEAVTGTPRDARSDLYSLGMTLYFALVGEPPASTDPSLPPAPRAAGHRPASVRPEVPEWLDAVVARATAAEPSARFETAKALLAALESHSAEPPRELAADPQLLGICILCREPGTLGQPVCPYCEDHREPTRRVFVRTLRRSRDLRERSRLLAGLTGLPADAPSLRRVARGIQPLLELSDPAAQQVERRLSAYGLDARRLPATRLSSRLGWVGSGGLAAGLGALLAGSSWLPLGALALGVSAISLLRLRTRSKPLLRAQGRRAVPRALVVKICEVAPRLEMGEPRRLLVETLRLGLDVHSRLGQADDTEPARSAVCDALIAAATASAELAAIEPVLQALVLHGEHRYELPPGLAESRAMFESARGALQHCLLEATATFSQLRSEEIVDRHAIWEHASRVGHSLGSETEWAAEMAKEALERFATAGRTDTR